jgi:ubiquinone/menaquinone biosynthesis C-methylase UbiE
MRVVDEMLELADVGPGDVVYDLGSSDGRIVIRAAEKYGARAVGYELDSSLVAQARRKARDEGVADRVTFHREDLFRADLSEATVVALYLLRSLNLKLRPKLLRELDPGDRVVSHDFDMKEWEPDEVTDMFAHRVYLWRIPEEIPEHLRSEPERSEPAGEGGSE